MIRIQGLSIPLHGKITKPPYPDITSDRYSVLMAAFFCLRLRPALKVFVLFNKLGSSGISVGKNELI